jgi:hypothetical protein
LRQEKPVEFVMRTSIGRGLKNRLPEIMFYNLHEVHRREKWTLA